MLGNVEIAGVIVLVLVENKLTHFTTDISLYSIVFQQNMKTELKMHAAVVVYLGGCFLAPSGVILVLRRVGIDDSMQPPVSTIVLNLPSVFSSCTNTPNNSPFC